MLALGLGLRTPLPFVTAGPEVGFSPSSALILDADSGIGASVVQLLRLAVPSCTILATSTDTDHLHHITGLGADQTFDRNSESLIEDVRSAFPGSRGVDAIVDALGAGNTQQRIFDAFARDGPKRYAPLAMKESISLPSGVDTVTFTGHDVRELQGSENLMSALQGLLEEGKYKSPLRVERVGEGFDMLDTGLERLRRGTGKEGLVVVL